MCYYKLYLYPICGHQRSGPVVRPCAVHTKQLTSGSNEPSVACEEKLYHAYHTLRFNTLCRACIEDQEKKTAEAGSGESSASEPPSIADGEDSNLTPANPTSAAFRPSQYLVGGSVKEKKSLSQLRAELKEQVLAERRRIAAEAAEDSKSTKVASHVAEGADVEKFGIEKVGIHTAQTATDEMQKITENLENLKIGALSKFTDDASVEEETTVGAHTAGTEVATRNENAGTDDTQTAMEGSKQTVAEGKQNLATKVHSKGKQVFKKLAEKIKPKQGSSSKSRSSIMSIGSTSSQRIGSTFSQNRDHDA